MKLTLTSAMLALGLALGAQTVHHGFDPGNMDTTASPCSDFFRYASGAWEKQAVIPGEYATYGVMQEMEERSFAILKDILEASASDKAAPRGSERQKVGAFYASGMDVAAIEKQGLAPLAPTLAKVASVHDGASLARTLAVLHGMGLPGAFRVGVEQDDRVSDQYIVALSQGGLGLPEREFYFKEDAKAKEIRAKYLQHVARSFQLLGERPTAAWADALGVVAFETRLAKASRTLVELRDPMANYNKVPFADLARRFPGLDWAAYFKALRVPGAGKDLLVRQPAFLEEVGRMAQDVPAAQWRSYLRWQALRSTADFLCAAVADEHFAFYGRTLQGIQVQKPRWKRVLGHTDHLLGEALGKLYVERAFPPQAKAKVLEIVHNLQTVLRARIRKLDWMSEGTKREALAKMDTLRIKIGYPDVWRDYAKLDLDRGPFLRNVLAARAFEVRRHLDHLGQPIDRNEWLMTPPTNNAYYEPTLNEICFPAGGLQPPFFDLEADDAVNYGNTGGTIGHEMIHGYDDEGRQYDAQGNLRDWWTAADAKAFEARAQLVVKQFDAFEPLPGMHINGKATLGENLADLAGLELAFDAFRLSQQGKPPAAPIDGFTPAQRFFLGYAEYWRSKIREESLRNRLMTDVHAPAKYRVLGPLANMPEFAEAFGCKEGDPMKAREQDRPIVW